MRHALALTFFLAISCFAQDSSQPTVSFGYTGGASSRYFGPTVSKTFSNHGVFQQELDITKAFGNATTVTGYVWNSIDLGGGCKNFACETDLGIGVARKFRKVVVSGTVGKFFLYPGAGFNVLQFDFKASRTFVKGNNALTLFVELQNRALTSKEVIHGSQYPMAGIAYQRVLAKRFFFTTTFRENYDIRGGFGRRNETSLFYGQAALSVPVTKTLSIIPLRVGFGGSYHDPERPTQFIWSGGIKKTF